MSSAAETNLLIVDDNQVNREMLELHLVMRGFKVTVADSGKAALELFHLPVPEGMQRRDEREIDLVLLDIMMPVISGLDVLHQLRRYYTRAELPVIMVTAKDASEDVVEALQLGANDYITKPIDFPVLFARVDAALQVQRLTRQKDEFLAIASHDLKNPLAIVRGFVKMIQSIVPEGQPMTGDARDMLARVFRQTTTMERIIGDFLDFQAMEEGQLKLKLRTFDLAELIDHLIQSQESYAASKDIKLSSNAPAPVRVTADLQRIEQVLHNYIGNAIKYGSAGGSVRINASRNGDIVRVEVRDDGDGIPVGEANRLFVKYARLSNRPTGGEKSSGLGLVICKQLIQMHGGQVGAHNNLRPLGATFWFELPVQPLA